MVYLPQRRGPHEGTGVIENHLLVLRNTLDDYDLPEVYILLQDDQLFRVIEATAGWIQQE